MYHTVTEESIAELVDTFYTRIRDDQLLRPYIRRDYRPRLGTSSQASEKIFGHPVVLAYSPPTKAIQ